MTEYKRWLPIIIFSIFLFILYNLNRFYKTENFDYSPFSLSGSGIQIKFRQDECLDDLSWISADNNYTCAQITEEGPGCYFSDVNGFTGFDKCPRSCGNCQDQLFPGDSPNNTMLSAPDALYDNESGEMLGQVTQGAMNIGNSTMATFSDKRLYEIEERFEERLSSMEEKISELLESVYDDILLGVAEQSGDDVTCLRNSDTGDIPEGKTVSGLTEDQRTAKNIPARCTDLHLDGYGATYCDSIGDEVSDSNNCLKCGNAAGACDSGYEITTTGITTDMDSIYHYYYDTDFEYKGEETNLQDICITVPNTFSTTINDSVTAVNDSALNEFEAIGEQIALNIVSLNGISNSDFRLALTAGVADNANILKSEWGASEKKYCCDTALADMSDQKKNECFKGWTNTEIRERSKCCFTPYELEFPSYQKDTKEIPKTTYKFNVNLNNDQEQINIHNLEKCINNSKTEEFEVFKWIPSEVSPDDNNTMPTDLDKNNSGINRNLGIMLPLNFTTNCYELKDMEKYFGENLTDYSCKNQIFTKSVEGRTIEWKNLYERCPIRCNENCRNLFDPDEDLGLKIKDGGNVDLFSDLENHPEAHYKTNVDYLKKISNELYNDNDPPVKIDGKRYMIDDIKKYLGVGLSGNINNGPYEAGINQADMNIKMDDSYSP